MAPIRRDTEGAAAYLHLPPSTLAYWRKTGAGPRWYKLGRRVLYDTSDLDAFVYAQKASA